MRAGVGVVLGAGVGVALIAGVDTGGVGVTGVGDGFGAGITGEAATGGVAGGVAGGVGVTGVGEGFGAGITGEAATGGVCAGAVPGQGRPVLPPHTGLDDAIATIISPGRCSAAMMEPVQVKPSRTAHTTARGCFFSMMFSKAYLPMP